MPKYDANGNPIKYDADGNPIAAPKATAPAPKAQAKPQPKAQPQAMPTSLDPLESFKDQQKAKLFSYFNDLILGKSRPMTEQEQGVKRDGTAREYASQISEARAQAGEAPTTAEMMFPASEAARRADIAEGKTPAGGYASEHIGPFIGDVLSFPSRTAGALGVHGALAGARAIGSGLRQLFTGESDYSGAGKSVNRVTDWMTDPTGVTGSPSGILLFAPGLNTEAIIAKSGEAAAAPAVGKLPQAIKAVSTVIANNPKKSTAVLRGLEGASTAAFGAGLDEFGKPLAHMGLGISAGLGGLGAPLGGFVSDLGMEALPGLRQTLNQSAKNEVNKGDKEKAYAETYELLKRNLRDIGVSESMLGATALENLWRKRLGKAGDLYDRVDEAMSPKTREWLANRGDPKFAEEYIAQGVSPEVAQLFHGKTMPPADLADEAMSWANPERTVTQQGASPYGPVTLQDVYRESMRRLLGRKEGLAAGTESATAKELEKELAKKFQTISTIMPYDAKNLGAYPTPLFRRDLSAMRNVANVKRGKTIQFGAGDMQNLIGEVVGDFASKHMYGNDLKLKALGLEPVARQAGKLYKEGKTVQGLVNANKKETTREKTGLGKLAAQTAFTEYRLPLLVNAIGNLIEKQSAKSGSSFERNR